MRFQAKLQKEQDQKRTELNSPTAPGNGGYYRTTTTVTTSSSNGSPTVGGGKVRQLFEERRQRGIGIDKSYPLQPISSTTTPTKRTSSLLDNGRPSPLKTTQPFSNTSTRTVTRPLPGGGHATTTRTVTTSSSSSKYDSNNNCDGQDFGEMPSSRYAAGGLAGLNGKLAGLSIQANEINNNGHNNNNHHQTIKLKPVNLTASSSATSTRSVINGVTGPTTRRTVTTTNGAGDVLNNNATPPSRSSPVVRSSMASPSKTPLLASKSASKATTPKATASPVRVS